MCYVTVTLRLTVFLAGLLLSFAFEFVIDATDIIKDNIAKSEH